MGTVGDDGAEYDVVIIGYGPVGRLLALKLGERGHRVLIIERQRTMYFLPRAVHLDDEAARILQSVGASHDDLPGAIAAYDDFYEWRNSAGETLVRLDWRGRGPSGWNVSNFFNQPLLERHLHALVTQSPLIDVVFGHTAIDLTDDGTAVTVTLEDAGERRSRVRGRYVVGADGSRSIVREWIGGSTTDLGYFHDWLVVDLVMKTDAIVFDPPAWQLCDPARPTTLVPGGPGRRRFEFMRLPDENAEDLNRTEAAWRLLEPWGIGPAEADLERHTLYTFQARWADAWRRGRVLIAGDAAHLMPPFAGQGMCSGLRDAVNLAWKLDLVLRGDAHDELLDTYGSERKEHVHHFITASMDLGEVICITDPDAAHRRDRAMRAELAAGVQPPPRPLPRLGEGLFEPNGAGGLLSVQTVVVSESGIGLFDTVAHTGGLLLLRDEDSWLSVSAESLARLELLGFAAIALGATPGPHTVVDVDGELQRWMTVHGAAAVLTRPDHYVFGVASQDSDTEGLVTRFLARLRAEVPA
jgi:2-polyprenyl-6-methoxyphenol hydroxylase-like FAD-dependent oxidoreductase